MSEIDTFVRVDPDKSTTFVRVQDVEPILEHNKELRALEQPSDWGRHVATIPNVIIEQWLHEEMNKGNAHIRLGTEEFDLLIARKLKNPDWAYLRTDKSASIIQGHMGFGS